jgi:hypothetical protein
VRRFFTNINVGANGSSVGKGSNVNSRCNDDCFFLSLLKAPSLHMYVSSYCIRSIATCVGNSSSAGVVTHDRRIGTRGRFFTINSQKLQITT